MPEKVVIIGSGPAGWSAAIYAARANLSPLVFEGTYEPEGVHMIPLGQLAYTTEVENYPGFPTAVQGLELMELMRQQAVNFDTRTIEDDIVDIDVSSRPYKVIRRNGESVETHAIIIATGARANYLGLESEEFYKNKGVSACAVCDGALPLFVGKELAVVGGGDSAVEEASYLANLKNCPKVHMVVRRDEMRASQILQDRAKDHPKIQIHWNTVVDEVLGDEKIVTGLRLKSTVDDSTSELTVGGMFVAIGHTPNTAFLQGKIDTNDSGYINWTKSFRTDTSVPGVFAAGDVADDYYRQAITSAGTGCMAALDVERWLTDSGVA
ncbi:UNVERIFIED_CONTAM: hypothetical protein GTU68_021592 [Idotea baltica]|nr:hypothetical protein [Idotea baltica]